jgi:hypothetical protein
VSRAGTPASAGLARSRGRAPVAGLATLAGSALLAGLAAGAATALAACPPPEPLLVAMRSAERIQFEQLGGDETRVETPLAHVPGRTLGHEVHGVFRASAAVAAALREAFGRRDSYACPGGAPAAAFRGPEGLPIGLFFTGPRGGVAVVLRLPAGEVQMQAEGDTLVRVPLSRSGQRRWEAALRQFAQETRTSPEEFYQQMLPPDRVPPAREAPADTTDAPADTTDVPGGGEQARGVTAPAPADRVRPA